MKILTLGDSWTLGVGSTDPATMSWPAQMATKYNVEVVNLGHYGCNQSSARAGINELLKRPNYDYVVFALGSARDVELLDHGLWRMISAWSESPYEIDRAYFDLHHTLNDVQYTIYTVFNFINAVKAIGVPCYITGLSFHPAQYRTELRWVNKFNITDFPPETIGISAPAFLQLNQTIKTMHRYNLQFQPEYFDDVVDTYLFAPETREKYGYTYRQFNKHPGDVDYKNDPEYQEENEFKFMMSPDDRGYAALADYFAGKIGLNSTN
jgi:hypothetical protein